MITITNKAECCGCGACVQICPQECIAFKPDFEGFWYPEIDTAKCTDCDLCSKVCFIKSTDQYIEKQNIENRDIEKQNIEKLDIKKQNNENFDLYATKNKDAEVKFHSSSGGMFTPLAEEIIRQGGVVFGCAFDENFIVCHSSADTIEAIAKFRKSKYVQSDIGSTYKEAKAALESGKKVLFSGLPCQIAGLKAFLQKDYEGLYCVDLICSGVSSPLVWKVYLQQLEREANSGITYANFRENIRDPKVLKPSSSNATLRVTFENGNEIYQHQGKADHENPFYGGFLTRLFSRPSCHACPSRGNNSGSDILIGDFWGLNRLHPEFCDKYEGEVAPHGTSQVMVFTDKGRELFNAVKGQLEIKKLDNKVILKEKVGNWFQLYQSFAPHAKRTNFFAEFDSGEFGSGEFESGESKSGKKKDVIGLIRKFLRAGSNAGSVYNFYGEFELMRDYMYKKLMDRCISRYLNEQKLKNIAIYGMGQIGQLFLWDMQKSGINVKYAIDRNAGSMLFCGIPTVKPDTELEKVDAIVICTLPHLDAVIKNLREKTEAQILPLRKLIFEA